MGTCLVGGIEQQCKPDSKACGIMPLMPQGCCQQNQHLYASSSKLLLSGFPDIRISGYPDIRTSGYPHFRTSGYPDIGYPDIHISGHPDVRISEKSGINKSRFRKWQDMQFMQHSGCFIGTRSQFLQLRPNALRKKKIELSLSLNASESNNFVRKPA